MIVEIIKGKGLGKKVLGYPTANAIVTPSGTRATESAYNEVRGCEGAWCATVTYSPEGDVNHYSAICGICKKNNNYILEIHILNFNYNLYDKNITIKLKHKIRDQITFKSLEESKAQLEKDIDFVKSYKSCSDCKFCAYQDFGYSNYTVEGTNIHCLLNKFEPYEAGYPNEYKKLGVATYCDSFNKGQHWSLDCDGEIEGPTDDWVKSEVRNLKIGKILD